MLTRSQRGKIVESDPEIEKFCRRNNVETRSKKIIVGGEQERTLQNCLTPCVKNYNHTALQSGRSKFHGLSLEDLMVHLRKFLRLTNMVKSPANALDYIRLVVFAFTLEGQAEDWFDDLSSMSIITWD